MQKNTDRVKISDIAKAAGVSSSTVSYVLSGQRSISEKTKAIVLEQVEKLGYRPNAIARSFVTNRSNTIGLYLSKNIYENDLFLLSNIIGITKVLNPRRYKLLLLDEIDNTADDFAVPVDRTFAIDGAIVSNTRSLAQYLSELEKERLPFVLMGKPPKGADVYYVDNDNTTAAYQMMEHLFRRNRSRIALVVEANPIATFDLDCIAGYTMACSDYQKEYDSRLIMRISREQADIGEFRAQLKALKVDGIILAAFHSGVRNYCIYQDNRPDRIPVIGFSFDLYKEFYPASALGHFYYINSNAVQLGMYCAEMLLNIIDGVPTEKTRILQQELLRIE